MEEAARQGSGGIDREPADRCGFKSEFLAKSGLVLAGLAALSGCGRSGPGTSGADGESGAAGAAGSAEEPTGPMPAPGLWRAALMSPGGALTVGLEFAEGPDGLTASFQNGEEHRPAGPVTPIPGGVVIEIPPYQSRIVAKIDPGGGGLQGTWERDLGQGFVPVLSCAALAGAPTDDSPTELQGDPATLTGRWRVQFDGDEDISVGLFQATADGRASGTFLTTLGDYRYLDGRFDGTDLQLACFDGAHAFLFTAARAEDGTLAGDFWSRDSYHTTWTAELDPDADLPDDFALTKWTGALPLAGLRFPDTEGVERALDDPEFAGDARLLVVFGSWCPNCNDLSEYLVELDGRYPGLSILGLAFEMGDDPERQRRAVTEYLAHHGATYPALICGSTDKKKASAALPILDRVRSYPTTVFMDGDGNVSAVHTGFSGPATGERYQQLRHRFESEIESLLQR